MKVGERLAAEGVLGRFALDFVAVARHDGDWETVRDRDQPAQGRHDAPVPHAPVPDRRRRTTRRRRCSRRRAGDAKYFVATDHVESPAYRALTPDDLFDLVVRHGLHFDQSRQTGVVFHMMSALGEYGRTGLTAVGDSPEEAHALYEQAVATLDEEAQRR